MKKSLSWQDLKQKSTQMAGWSVYWIRPGDRKQLLHGTITVSTWWDPISAFGLTTPKGEWGEAWLIKLIPSSDVPHDGVTVDPRLCPDTPYELPNGDIQIPYGVGTYHFTNERTLNEELAFAV